VLQGDGGDEMFAGYRRYQVLNNERFWQVASRAALAASAVLPKNARYYRSVRFFTAMAAPDPALRMALLMTVETPGAAPDRILSPELRRSIAGCDPFQRYRELHERFASLDAVQRMLYIDASVVLPDAFLEKVDKSTMAHGIEVRVPFLDTALATYAMSLPSRLKVRRFEKKWILRKALRGVVPDAILDGPKTGFGVPYEYWLRQPLAEYMKSVLFDSSIESAGIFDRQELERRVAEHISGARDHGFLLWKALQLALWYGQVYRPGSSS
jgi:asparagine synthase (glutamine-hydrolysing)